MIQVIYEKIKKGDFMEKKISWYQILVIIVILDIYIMPTFQLDMIGFPIMDLITVLFLIYSYIINIKEKNYHVNAYECLYILLIIVVCFYQKTIAPAMLLTPLIAYNYLKEIKKSAYYFINSFWIYIALLFTIIYSLLYGVQDGRFLHTGIYEVNSSGLAILWLGLAFLKKNKLIGCLILVFGCFSLSRNYYIALFVCLALNKKIVFFLKKINIANILSFKWLMIISTVLLYIIGLYSENLYNLGLIVNEQTLRNRLNNFFDLSNYLRFTVNVYTINIFFEYPLLLLTGINNDLFKNLCQIISQQRHQLYLGNNPHNFVLSYLKIYGVSGLLDMLYVDKIIKKVVNANNFAILICVSLYCIFLSVGVNGEWLFLVLFIFELYN